MERIIDPSSFIPFIFFGLVQSLDLSRLLAVACKSGRMTSDPCVKALRNPTGKSDSIITFYPWPENNIWLKEMTKAKSVDSHWTAWCLAVVRWQGAG